MSSIKIDCPICNKGLVERNGKFGKFTCCPSGKHVSFSIQNEEPFYTGEVGKMLYSKWSKTQPSCVGSSSVYEVTSRPIVPSLTRMVMQQATYFGGSLAIADEFIDITSESVWSDEDQHDPENWWNMDAY